MKKLIFIFLAVGTFFSNINAEINIANIDNQMIIMDDGVSVDQTCQEIKKQSNASGCRCCIVDALLKFKTWSMPDPVVGLEKSFNKCSERQFCDKNSLDELKKNIESQLKAQKILQENSDNQTKLTETYNYLVKRNLPIKEVPVTPEDLKADGRLTEQGVVNILTTLCKNNQMNECPLSPNCVKVNDIFAGAKGWMTEQLFSYRSTCGDKPTDGIVKGIPVKDNIPLEAMALDALNFTPFSAIIWPSMTAGLPTLAIPVAYLKYTSSSGKNPRYLSLMPMAKGKVFLDYIQEYIQNPSDTNYAEIVKMFERFGQDLAAFHKKFAKEDCARNVYTHIDLHSKNIFYDKTSGRITFIDNDQLAKDVSGKKFPILLNQSLFSSGTDLTTPVKDMRIMWDTLGRWSEPALANEKFMKGSIEAFMKGYKQGWGDKASCVMETIKGKSGCLDSLLSTFKVESKCKF